VPIIMFAYLTCFLDRGNIGMTISFSILRIWIDDG
jgi:hypothetical protein